METYKTQEQLRQSALMFTQNYIRNLSVKISLEHTLRISNIIYDYYCEGYSQDIADAIKAIDDYIESLYSDE